MDGSLISDPLKLSKLSSDQDFPIVVRPSVGRGWEECIVDIHRLSRERIHKDGALLFRGFDLLGDKPFQRFAESFGHSLLSYEFGSTPRSEVDKGVYTSTEYPSHQVIPLHNEQSYTLHWPMKIWFHCVQPSDEGGETPIADSRRIYAGIDPMIRNRFAQKRLMYVRNYGNGLDLPWQRAFNTDDPVVVEQFCKNWNIVCEWKADGELRTRQVCQAVARHPFTDEMVWFNQAHLFHASNMAPELRETLLSVVGQEIELPRNVYYGDGSPLEEEDLNHIRGVLNECTIAFPWERGDILMLDNMLVAHGRSTFKGSRKVIVAMAEAAPAQAA